MFRVVSSRENISVQFNRRDNTQEILGSGKLKTRQFYWRRRCFYWCFDWWNIFRL